VGWRPPPRATWVVCAVVMGVGLMAQNVIASGSTPVPVPNQFFARGEDPPRYQFRVPADGTYLLQVSSRDADTDASPRHLYRVRITPEQPDFRLVLMPPSLTAPDACLVRRGATQFYTA